MQESGGGTRKKRIDAQKKQDVLPTTIPEMEESKIMDPKPETKKTIDVVFVIDATGSMKPHIKALKESLVPLAKKIASSSQTKDFEAIFGIVFYRDKDDKEPYRVVQLESIANYLNDQDKNNKPAFIQELEDIKMTGGDDLCDDAETGIRKALDEIEWKSNDRFIVLLADYPCHGISFNGGFEDFYAEPEGDYNADQAMENTLKRFSENICPKTKSTSVAYRLVGLQITSFTETMYKRISEILGFKTFFKLNITNEKFKGVDDDKIQEISKTIANTLGGTIKKNLKVKKVKKDDE